MNKEMEEYVEFLLKKGNSVAMVALSTEVPVIQVYTEAIKLFGEREDLVDGLKLAKEFYGVE